ncbi:XrtA/PEP-CTERM system TPR-repeat protein PrsT [Catenovulum maritimum]|uniref:Tetratricopeptide repeat-like domain-containing protein n=1 Tax=Catenovulum maritimum TaxID=1513271 RepID=A0A0J8JN39_9ALTE|nr:XrtA/PEP-CTERM system TPR-repeat protein PrsT [Catenovulum maritimum]KMT66011.1 hypothetical protein XM47_06045 [Catenovulum maritimum]
MQFLKAIQPFLLASFISFSVYAEQAGDRYEKALKAFHQGQTEAAVIHLKSSLQISPDFTPARILLGKIYLQQEDCLSSEKELQNALDSGGDWSQILPMLVECKIQLNKIEQADELLIQYKYKYQNDPSILTLKSKLLLQQEKYTQAESLLNQVIQYAPDLLEAKLVLAETYEKQLKLESAQTVVQQVLEVSAQNVPANLLFARILESSNQLTESLAIYDKILAFSSENVLALLGKTSILQKLGRGEEALNLVVSLRDRMPNNPFVNLLYATISGANLDQGRETKSILADINHQLSLVDKEKVPSSQIYLLTGYVNYLTAKYDSARRDFLNYKLMNENDAQIYKILAETEIKRKDTAQAYQYYLEYNFRKPKDEFGLTRLLSLASKHETKQEFKSRLEKAYQAFPHNNSIRNHLVALNIADNNLTQARQLIAQNSSVSNNFLLDLELARLLIQLNELPLAGKVVSSLIQQDALNPHSHQTAANLYLKAGNLPEARKFLEQALAIQADFYPALLTLASIELNAKNYDEVTSILDKVQGNQEEVNGLKASLAIAQGQYYKAINLLEANYLKNKALTTAKSLIELYLRTNEQNKAEALITTIVKENRLDPDVLDFQVRLAIANNQVDSATRALRTLFGLNYDKAQLLKRLFVLNTQAGDLEGQVKIINRLEKLDVEETEILFLTAQYQLNAKQFSKAANSLKQLVSFAGTNESIRELEFNLAFETQDYALAEKIISNLFLTTRKVEHFKSLIGTLLKQAKYSEAEAQLKVWINQYPKDMTAIYLLASCYKQQNKLSLTISLLEKANESLESAITHHKLAYLYQTESLEKAVKHAEKAYKLQSESVAFTDTYGWFLALSERYSEALHYLRLAHAKNASQPDLVYHLAYTLDKLNRHYEAYELLDNVLKRQFEFKNKSNAVKLKDKLERVIR